MELLQFKILNTAIERILNSEMADIGLTYTQASVRFTIGRSYFIMKLPHKI